MSLNRIKKWTTGETLYANDINEEFDNIYRELRRLHMTKMRVYPRIRPSKLYGMWVDGDVHVDGVLTTTNRRRS